MLKKTLFISLVAVVSFLGVFGTAFAEDSSTSLRGTDQFSFNAPEPKGDIAARNYVYDQGQLAMIGTEGGGEIKSSSQALQAARSYSYDQAQVASVGTEGGNWQFSFDNQPTHSSQGVADKRGAVCISDC